MLRGNWRGQRLGSDLMLGNIGMKDGGKINEKQWQELEAGIARPMAFA